MKRSMVAVGKWSVALAAPLAAWWFIQTLAIPLWLKIVLEVPVAAVAITFLITRLRGGVVAQDERRGKTDSGVERGNE